MPIRVPGCVAATAIASVILEEPMWVVWTNSTSAGVIGNVQDQSIAFGRTGTKEER